jgi:hypothetical protein
MAQTKIPKTVTQNMSWESRRGRGGYYTRSRRHNGKIIREYVGSGPLAEFAYQSDLDQRLARAERRKQELAIQAADRAADQIAKQLEELVSAILEARTRARGKLDNSR